MEFLRTIFTHKNPTEWIDVSVFEPGYPIRQLHKRRFFTDPQEAEAWGLEYSKGKHVSFGLIPRKVQGSHKEDTSDKWGVLWADIDLPVEKAREMVDLFLLPPTALVCSGKNVHAYWVLSQSIAAEEGTLLQRELSTLTAGDTNTSNSNRLMRLPGTQNMKDINNPLPCFVLSIDPTFVYTPQDIRAALNTAKCPVILRRQMKHAVKPKGKSNSELDYKAIMHLLRAGMSEDGIKSVLLNPNLRLSAIIGEKISEDDHYLKHTLVRAMAEYGSGAKVAKTEVFTQKEDGIYIGDVRVSTFTIEPTLVIRGEEDTLYCTISAPDVILNDVALPRSAFNSMAALLGRLGSLSCQWIGSERQVRQLLPYLAERARLMEVPEIPGVAQVGVYDEVAVSKNQVVHKDMGTIPITAAPVFLTSAELFSDNYNTDWRGFSGELYLRQLHKHVISLNTPQRIIPLLGWFMALPFKSKLSEMKYRFPLIMAWGTRGGGKTSAIENVFQPLLGIRDGGVSCLTTHFALIKTLSASNAIVPAYLTEYRASNYNRVKFEAMLRMVYDESKEQRGRPDGSVKEYPLTAPVIITGEDAFTDPALIERIIMVRFSEKDIDGDNEYTQSLKALKQMNLHEFSLPYIQHCLGVDAEALHKEAQEFVEGVEAWQTNVPHRMKHGIIVCTMGLLSYSQFLAKHGIVYTVAQGDVTEAWDEYLMDFLGTRGRTLLAADEFVREIILAVLYGTPHSVPFPYRWEKEHGIIWFHMTSAYNWWVSQARKRGTIPLEMKAVTAQLREVKYASKPKTQRDSKGKATMQMYPISVVEAAKSIEDIPSDLSMTTLARVK